MKISQDIQNAAQSADAGTQQTGQTQSDSNGGDDDVQDVDFEEVK